MKTSGKFPAKIETFIREKKPLWAEVTNEFIQNIQFLPKANKSTNVGKFNYHIFIGKSTSYQM